MVCWLTPYLSPSILPKTKSCICSYLKGNQTVFVRRSFTCGIFVLQKFKGSCRQKILLSSGVITAASVVMIKAKHSAAGSSWNSILCWETYSLQPGNWPDEMSYKSCVKVMLVVCVGRSYDFGLQLSMND